MTFRNCWSDGTRNVDAQALAEMQALFLPKYNNGLTIVYTEEEENE